MAKTATATATAPKKPSAADALKAAKAGAAAKTVKTPKAAKAAPIAEPEVLADPVDQTEFELAGTATDEMTVFEHLISFAQSSPNGGFVATQGQKETEQQFLARIMRSAMTGTDEAYEKMSEAAQDFYNANVDAANTNRDIAVPAGFPAREVANGEAKPAGKGRNMDALKAFQAKARAEKEAAIARGEVPAPKAKKTAEPKEAKGPGSVGTIRRVVFQHPDWTVEQVHAEVTKLGITTQVGTVSTTRAGALDAIEAMRELGMLKA